MNRFLAASVITVLTLAAPGARADGPAPSAPSAPAPSAPSARDAAREHYRRGKALQAQAAYGDAIAEYEQGFALVAMPEFLFNIAQCYRLSGDLGPAVDYYRRYLDAAPDGAGADEARGHIVSLTRELDAQRREAAAKAPPPSTAAPAAPSATTPLTDAPAAPAAPPWGAFQYSGIGAGVVGFAAAGVATYYAVEAQRLSDDVSRIPENMWTDELTAKYHDGQRDAKIALGLYIGAGALVAGGVVAYVWGPRPAPAAPSAAHAASARVQLTPSAGPSLLGLSLSGTF